MLHEKSINNIPEEKITQFQNQQEAKANNDPGDKLTANQNSEDIMIRDPDPIFRENVEAKVMNSLQQKSKMAADGRKLINWNIYNAGQQTIIVL